MTEQELLAQLRDVHLPENPGWWPPAIGWWLLACLLIGLLLGALFWISRWRANAWRRAALHEHQRLVAASHGNAEVVRELSVLMRRVAIKAEPRQQVASATDQQWLTVLDRIGQTNEYTDGVGGLLTVWPYRDMTSDQAASTDQLNSLFRLTRQTIERVSLTAGTGQDPRPEPGPEPGPERGQYV